MAGRPKQMAKRAAMFEEQAMRLATHVSDAMPVHYREGPDNPNPLCEAWNNAEEAVTAAVFACESLGDLLRERAGITEPGPTAQRCEADCKRADSQGIGEGTPAGRASEG